MWAFLQGKGCPDCGEAIAVQHMLRCQCPAERLLLTRPAPVFCPTCEEGKAKAAKPRYYPDHIDWQVCAECQLKEEEDKEPLGEGWKLK
jgi:hypothetical protein